MSTQIPWVPSEARDGLGVIDGFINEVFIGGFIRSLMNAVFVCRWIFMNVNGL